MARIRKFGRMTSTVCDPNPGTKTVFTALTQVALGEGVMAPLDRVEGLAIGDFKGEGEFAVYFAMTENDAIIKLTATNPQTFTATVFALFGQDRFPQRKRV
jgi:hypothetical protein